jgi:hypothetical protein
MANEYSFTIASNREWLVAFYLLMPPAAGLLAGVAFAYLARWRGWPPDVISIAPISVMCGVLSYVVAVVVFMTLTLVANFTFFNILRTIILVLFFTWPIALGLGSFFFVYMTNLRQGRKITKDSTVFCVSGLCLILEILFLKVSFLVDS